MPTRTISNTGGNYNSTATWIEGIIPTSADDVISTASSGPLIINVASAARSFNFTDEPYTNTLTVNAIWTVSGGSAITNIFSSSMTIGGTSNIALTGTGSRIESNGLLIPNLSISGNKTLDDDLNVVNLTFTSGSVFSGVAGRIIVTSNLNSTTSQITILTSISLLSGTINLGNFSGTLNLGSTGSTATITGSNVGIGLNSAILNYFGGTLNQVRVKALGIGNITINGNGAEFESYDQTGILATLTFSSEFKVKYFNIGPGNYNYVTQNITNISGTGSLNVTNSMNILSEVFNSTGVIQYRPSSIGFNTGPTHTIASINANGFGEITSNTTGSTAFGNIRSTTSGTRAKINLLNPSASVISNMNVTDINFTGPAAFKLNGGAITNSLNITQATIGAGSTSLGGSWTFVN